MAQDTLPDSHAHLLDLPAFAHLATVRPDGSPQSEVMWFAWDGDLLRFTHTSTRQKYRNLQDNPRVALSISDPSDPYRYLEVRGEVAEITPDPQAAFYQSLMARYGRPSTVTDADVRVVVAVRPTSYVAHG